MDTVFTHFDHQGNAVMTDISKKEITARVAVAKGEITMNQQAFSAAVNGGAAKGDVMGVARLAGIMAAKKTPMLIPLCHTLVIDSCTVEFVPLPERLALEVTCTVKTTGRTGAEMEALTGASTALLTVYDMCKALDRAMVIGNLRLTEKSGGKSGHYRREG